MKANTAALLKSAQQAAPPVSSKSNWSEMFPVIETLIGRGFSAWAACNWLTEQGALPADRRRNLYHSYLGYAKRRDASK